MCIYSLIYNKYILESFSVLLSPVSEEPFNDFFFQTSRKIDLTTSSELTSETVLPKEHVD